MGPRWGLATEQGGEALDFATDAVAAPPPPLQGPDQDAFIRKKANSELSNVESGMRRSSSLPELKPRSGKLPPLTGVPPLPGCPSYIPLPESTDPLGFNLLGLSSKMDRPTSRFGGPRPPRQPPPMKALRRLLSDEDQANPLGLADVKGDAAETTEVLKAPAPKIKTLQLPPCRSKRRSSKKPNLPPILESAALKILSARSDLLVGAWRSDSR